MHFHALSSFYRRELRIALGSRLMVALPLAGLALGVAPLLTHSRDELAVAAPLFLLQGLLYGLPLAGIMAGTGSCQAEADEAPLLASLPVCRMARAVGKFAGLMTVLAGATLLAVLPSVLAGVGVGTGLLLLGYGLGIASLFTALGMLCGLAIRDGVKAHFAALLLWLLLTLGTGLAGYVSLGGLAQAHPALWAAALMLSPLDALRVGVLFSVQSAPFAMDALPGLTRWWLLHPGLWFAILATATTAGFLTVSARASSRAA